MKKQITIPLIIALTCWESQSIAQTSVGWGNDCDYDMNLDNNALQQAIDDGASELRITNQNEYMTNLSIQDQINIRGGFADCTNAENDVQTNVKSTINADGTGSPTISVFDVENADILLDTLQLINGSDTGLRLVKLSGVININAVEISANAGTDGGGLYAFNFQTTGLSEQLVIELNNSVIKDNTSAQSGGGISCQGGFGDVSIVFNLSGGTLIHSNHADSRGGGIYLMACDLDFTAGLNTSENNGDKEIWGNTSDRSGGGISIQDAKLTLQGIQNHVFDLTSNQSGNINQTNESGGGLFAVGTAEVTLTNAHVTGNTTQRYGGGIYAGPTANVVMDTSENGCLQNAHCSVLQANQVVNNLGAGAAFAAINGNIDIHRTLIAFNDSNGMGYIGLAQNNAKLNMEGNLILDNGIGQGFNPTNGFQIQDDATVSFLYNTTDGQAIAVPFINATGTPQLNLIGNIIDETADILHTDVPVSTNVSCNMLAQVNNITVPMTDTMVDVISFVEPGSFGNYQLAEDASNAMDVCSETLFEPGRDLANAQRGVDNPDVVDLNGLFDLGAYEFNPAADVIFANSFE